nr:MAG TPA_asm: hypothetical protein [Caudoviricetes sp.]
MALARSAIASRIPEGSLTLNLSISWLGNLLISPQICNYDDKQ